MTAIEKLRALSHVADVECHGYDDSMTEGVVRKLTAKDFNSSVPWMPACAAWLAELANNGDALLAIAEAAERVGDRCPKPRPGVAQWTSEGEMAIEALREALRGLA